MYGVLQPAEMCTKNGERAMEILRTKHRDVRPMTAASLDTYQDCPPEIISVDITNDKVAEVEGRLYGGAGPGGTESVSLQH